MDITIMFDGQTFTNSVYINNNTMYHKIFLKYRDSSYREFAIGLVTFERISGVLEATIEGFDTDGSLLDGTPITSHTNYTGDSISSVEPGIYDFTIVNTESNIGPAASDAANYLDLDTVIKSSSRISFN